MSKFKLLPAYLLVALLWFFMFSPWTSHFANFWAMMVAATGFLTLYSFIAVKDNFKEIYQFKAKWLLIGIASAAILYFLFFVGSVISNLIFDFSKHEVLEIYSTKTQADKVLIGTALLLWIGPAEEIFWRGFAQEKLSKYISPGKAYFINSLIYAFVHIWSFNFMLVMAALICGLFWGLMYYKYKNVIPCIISHGIWDLFVFVIIPFN